MQLLLLPLLVNSLRCLLLLSVPAEKAIDEVLWRLRHVLRLRVENNSTSHLNCFFKAALRV